MPDTPLLITERLRLEPFTAAHLTERYVGWLNDPETVRYSRQRFRRHTLESCRAYWRSFAGTPNHLWAIVEQGGLGHIGNINAYVDTDDQVADIGVMIGEPRARGRGLAQEAWVAVCRWLLTTDGVRKVTGGTLAANEPMVRLMERIGMGDDGRRVRHMLWEGRAVDVVHRAFFRDDPALLRLPAPRVGERA